MAKASTIRLPGTYVLKDDRGLPAEQQTVFQIAPLSIGDAYRAKDIAAQIQTGNGSWNFAQGSVEYFTLKKGLKGWTNLTDESGAQVLFTTDENKEVNDLSLARLTPEWRAELADAIRGAFPDPS